MYRASFHRKSSAVSLCKSIESAIQWFLINHGITFVTIQNPAVYLSGARVSKTPTVVPRLLTVMFHCTCTNDQVRVSRDPRYMKPSIVQVENILKRKSFATVLHPFFLQYCPCENILMIISYVPAQ